MGIRNGRRRWARLMVAGLAGVLVAAVPNSAWAHAELVSNGSVPRDSDQKLDFNVPEEKGADVHNTKVVFAVPAGFKVAGCEQKPNWNCTVSGASAGRTAVTFARTAGNEKDERFSFNVRTPGQGGDYSIPTNQSYSDNSTARWNGPPDSDSPAPVLKVT
jgi:uncharacterized protein YcnI